MKRREFSKIISSGFLGIGFSQAINAGTFTEPLFDEKAKGVIDIGSRLELFVDRYLIERLEGVELRLHEPKSMPLSESPLPVGYTTVIKDGNLYRGYYLDYRPDYDGDKLDGNPGEILCYAESINGHDWIFPDLNIVDATGPYGRRNVILAERPFCHSFAPFIDTRNNIDNKERYKALSGASEEVYSRATGRSGGGLFAFVSDDGIHWRKKGNKPVVPYRENSAAGETKFDSLNVVFWSEAEQLYVCYFRTRDTPYGPLRTISRVTSPDFMNWSDPVPMHPNLPGEHMYTNNTHPYFRAPHIYISLPTRFLHEHDAVDIILMSTRAGTEKYDRPFPEAFIRPGLDPARWERRSNWVAQNVVPTGEHEMSIYHSDNHRYILRTDGFVSVRAGAEKGEMLTRPLTFSGNSLVINYSTAAAGSLQAELQTEDGLPIRGYRLDDCLTIIGDHIERTIHWKGDPGLEMLSGKPVRIRFVMTECDLYSFGFK